MTVDYKQTVFLPKTDFSMRAGLPKKEPEFLERWLKMDLYARQRQEAKGRLPFVLHDGPPYANGNLHIGHALNKILKDIVVRSRQMMGCDAAYVPGWDCHGLPIEWKVEESYRKKGRSKDDIPVTEFRRECREFAEKWVDVQREEFRRLGVSGEWDRPYTTMDYKTEAKIVEELGHFLLDGSLYRGSRPVLWSVVEKTALAEAEVEYRDHESRTIWVRFPIVRPKVEALTGADVVIWTTTPWTIPGNRALACHADLEYGIFRVTAVSDGARVAVGDRLVVAMALSESLMVSGGFSAVCDAMIAGRDLEGSVCAHPLRDQGYDAFDVPVLAGDFVTADQGTGIVHQAPAHGEDDFHLCKTHGIHPPEPETVLGNGTYAPHVPLFAGNHIYKIDDVIVGALVQAGQLVADGTLVHSYPHSWRSKARLIYRTTAQWFIDLSRRGLRENALRALDEVDFVPKTGRNRLRSMIERRPDWCISRQRSWGSPLAVFVCKKTGAPLRDPDVMARIVAAIAERGADAWFQDDPQTFLGDRYQAADYEQVRDVLDVWFDSGCTHAFFLEKDGLWPADLYLEGSDQHRGWFQSSLLQSCGTRGKAPYKAVLTHGFILDGQGRKMSKSLGNVVSPQDVVKEYGADVLRLWVASSDYVSDLRVGSEILQQNADTYRRLRNTLRYMLGALDGFSATEGVTDTASMPELERWVLHRLAVLDETVRRCCESYEFHTLLAELTSFCVNDLSAFYFDIRKDLLYCGHPRDFERRACRTVLDRVFNTLVRWMAPILCFTAEEAWLCRYPTEEGSIHLSTFESVPQEWRDEDLALRWSNVARVRRAVLGGLEQARNARLIGSSLQAHPVVFVSSAIINALGEYNLADICITSALTLSSDSPPCDVFFIAEDPDIKVSVCIAEGEKCQRCWKVLPDVGQHSHQAVCARCDDVLAQVPVEPA